MLLELVLWAHVESELAIVLPLLAELWQHLLVLHLRQPLLQLALLLELQLRLAPRRQGAVAHLEGLPAVDSAFLVAVAVEQLDLSVVADGLAG